MSGVISIAHLFLPDSTYGVDFRPIDVATLFMS